MCKWSKYGDTRIDLCMRELIKWLSNKHQVILSCCGHGKYPPSVIIKEGVSDGLKNKIVYREIFSGLILREITKTPIKYPRKFYKRDKQGYYYIPEVINGR